MPNTTYLAGPIQGRSDEDCAGWREAAKAELPSTLDPFRRDFRGRELDNPEEIVSADIADIESSDFLLANCWTVSAGTSMEIFLASQMGKVVITVVPDPAAASPWIVHHSDEVHSSLWDAIQSIKRRISER